MAGGLRVARDRRSAARVPAEQTSWKCEAFLRPGQDVVIVNVGVGGALLESHARMSPGGRAELQLMGESRCLVRGRITRCCVVRLDPLCYRGAIVFDAPLDVIPTARASSAAA